MCNLPLPGCNTIGDTRLLARLVLWIVELLLPPYFVVSDFHANAFLLFQLFRLRGRISWLRARQLAPRHCCIPPSFLIAFFPGRQLGWLAITMDPLQLSASDAPHLPFAPFFPPPFAC